MVENNPEESMIDCGVFLKFDELNTRDLAKQTRSSENVKRYDSMPVLPPAPFKKTFPLCEFATQMNLAGFNVRGRASTMTQKYVLRTQCQKNRW